MTHDDTRDYFEEAIRIVRGESLLLPQVEHLRALDESRLFWREAASKAREEMPGQPELRRVS